MPAARHAATPPAPITVERARELLGRDAEGMTDAEVLDTSRQAEAIAHIIVAMFQERRIQ